MHYFKEVLRKYSVFQGRARRAEYWYFVLFSSVISMGFGVISLGIGDENNILGNLYGLAVLIPSLAVSVRRLHDIGKSGWMILILLIPLVGAIWFIILMARDTQEGDNKYGPNPKIQIPPVIPAQQ